MFRIFRVVVEYGNISVVKMKYRKKCDMSLTVEGTVPTGEK